MIELCMACENIAASQITVFRLLNVYQSRVK